MKNTASKSGSDTESSIKAPPASLHQQILSEIESRILSGEWPPGYRIPFEHELTAQYQCSRMTVNKALSQLAQAGLIERRRKAGSFVRRPSAQSAVLEIKDIRAEVLEAGQPYSYEILSRKTRRALPADRKMLDVEPGSSLLAIACRHFAAGQPFCLEERLIHLDIVPDAAEADFSQMSPGPWLVRRVAWTSAEHRIRALAADAETARMLNLDLGAPCLVVERRTWSADRPVTWVRLTYPGVAQELIARFEPSQS